MKRALGGLLLIALLGLMLSFVLGPFVWQVITALKQPAQLAQLPPLLPEPPTGQNFATVFSAPGFLRAGWNSVLVAVLTVLGISAFAVAAPAAAANSAEVSAVVAAHGGGGRYGEAVLAAAADMLGLTVEELQTQLRAGESLADLADEAGVAVEDLLAAMDEAATEAAREAIEQAVTDGDLTREHADWLLEGLDNGYWGPGSGGRGFGFGGPGGFGGPRGGGLFNAPVDDVPSADSTGGRPGSPTPVGGASLSTKCTST